MLNSMLINLFIIIFILLVIHCVWQNNKNKIKINLPRDTLGKGQNTGQESQVTAYFFTNTETMLTFYQC